VPHPLRELAHDHRDLNELIVAVNEALTRLDRRTSRIEDELHEIRDGIEAFRDALLEHFAREQEGLLPFVVGRLPAFEERSQGLIVEHDRIAATLSDVARDIARIDETSAGEASMATWRVAFARLEELYVAHARSELAFLEDVATALAGDASATDQLRDLLKAS
jgi:hemerythrin-like domain-containing protein